MNQARAAIRDMADQMGAVLSEKTLRRIAKNVLTFGWNDSQIRDTLAGSIQRGNAEAYGGQAAVNAQTLNELALANGVQIGDKQLREWLVRIGAGEDIATYEGYIRNLAKGAFPGYEEQLDAGMNIRDIADPYVQQMARTLELSPDSIDLFDPTIRKTLQAVDPATGKVTQKPLWQFERELRQDPRWMETKNAREDVMGKARGILQEFGLVS